MVRSAASAFRTPRRALSAIAMQHRFAAMAFACAAAAVALAPAPRARAAPRSVLLRAAARSGPAFNASRPARAARPPAAYADVVPTPSSLTLEPIGVVRSPYNERFGTPRQATVTAQTAGGEVDGTIVLNPRFAGTLKSLAGFDAVWVVSYLHLNTGWKPTVRPPRGPRDARHGVFATRAPHRPNPLGLSALRVVAVDEAKLEIAVRGLDLLDGTPVLDVKPYVPYCDAFPDARAGWVDDLDGPADGPDRLAYWPPPNHIR